MTRLRKTLISLATLAALAAGGLVQAAEPQAPAAPAAGATPCPYGGPGMGYGPGPGFGRGQGYGPGPGYGRGAMGPGAGYGPGYGRGGPGAGPGAWGGGPGRGPGFSPAAMVDGRLAMLKTELAITANQETAWQAFTNQAKAQVATMQAHRAAFTAEQTAPERLAQRAAFAKQRAANIETMSAAVKDLYGTLTPEQKVIADQRLAFGGMGGRGGWR